MRGDERCDPSWTAACDAQDVVRDLAEGARAGAFVDIAYDCGQPRREAGDGVGRRRVERAHRAP
jgi:hypothetical protein